MLNRDILAVLCNTTFRNVTRTHCTVATNYVCSAVLYVVTYVMPFAFVSIPSGTKSFSPTPIKNSNYKPKYGRKWPTTTI